MSIWGSSLTLTVPARDNFGDIEPEPDVWIDVATGAPFTPVIRVSVGDPGPDGGYATVYLAPEQARAVAEALFRAVPAEDCAPRKQP